MTISVGLKNIKILQGGFACFSRDVPLRIRLGHLYGYIPQQMNSRNTVYKPGTSMHNTNVQYLRYA